MFNTLNVLEHILCVFLFGGIKDHGHLYFDVLVAKANLYNVSDLNVIGRLNYFAVYQNPKFGQEITQNKRVECWRREGIEWDVYLKEVCLAYRLLQSFFARNARKILK